MFTVSASPFILDYKSSRPSPLIARDLNACLRLPPSPTPAMIRPISGGSNTQAKRRAQFDPRFQRKDTEPARRRDLFLLKVKQGGNDQRWEARGEQMLRRDFLTRQRDWEAELARSAPKAPAASDDEDTVEGGTVAQGQIADSVMDEVLSQEEQELEALVSSMEADSFVAKNRDDATAGYGSEEEDYDRLFMEVLEQPERMQAPNTTRPPPNNDGEMDISMG